jgi:Uma2 family endonuclease
VSDTTLTHDQTVKQRIYARARIPIYWIVNLRDRQVEVYTDPSGPTSSPRYRHKQIYEEDQSVPLVLDGKKVGSIAVRDLLP